MARIRTIKPEFPQSETVGRLTREARLLYIQLWTIVDDAGRARASSRMLASLLYPYDADAGDLIDGWLTQLEANGCVRRYTVDGSHFLDLPKWLKHQKIDKPSESKLPAFDDGSPSPREPSRALPTDLVPVPRTKEEDQEGKEGSEANASGATNAPLPEKELFDRGKAVLGKNSGGLIARLLKAKAGQVALARSVIETASTKQNPTEYVGRVLAGQEGLPPGWSVIEVDGQKISVPPQRYAI